MGPSYQNQLVSLDLSDCTELKDLACTNNRLSALDLSKNMALINLDCSGNKIEILDISNNMALENIDISFMPTLGRVCVWELPFPSIWVSVDTLGSPNVYFSSNCN